MNPRMLTLARESRALTQKELSEMSGVAQTLISKAENEVRPLKGDELDSLAAALRVTPELLRWPDEPYGFGSASFFHRKQQSLPQKTLKQIQANVNLLRMRLSRLLNGIDVETERAIVRIDIDAVGGPQEAARRLRAAWQLPMGPVDGLVAHIEGAGGVIVRRDFGAHRINAISVWHPGSGPLFVLNETLTPERQRFVLAHELGHMVMHEGEPPREFAEREADLFAEEFLMPAAEVRPELQGIDLRKAAALKPYWRVPMQSLILRAEHLGVISNSRCRSLHAYMNKLGYLPIEPNPVSREEPTVLSDVIRVHLNDHQYSTQELAHSLGMFQDELSSQFSVPRGGLRVVS